MAANTLEGGSNGTTITAGNSGGTSGDAFDSVVIATNDSLVFDNAHAKETLALKAATGASSTGTYAAWTTTIGTQTTFWGRMYLYRTANPSAQVRLFAAVGAAV